MSKKKVLLDGKTLSIKEFYKYITQPDNYFFEIHPDSLAKMRKARNFVLEVVEKQEPVYGINTGFGALASTHISKSDLGQLQVNLIRSHCTGVGECFDSKITRAIMFIRANCLISGYSGLQPELVELLLAFINHQISPLIPMQGSVGASGDLAPLSHLALALIGEGKVIYEGKELQSDFVLNQLGLKPGVLGPKDGLALINGTSVMNAMGAIALQEASELVQLADIISALTLDGIQGTHKAFHPLISMLKPHPGQVTTSKNINNILEGSEILESHTRCHKVQDPYSLRCIPQVHGAIRQTVAHAKEVLEIELNSVTDNPLVFTDEELILSGGNFHGEAIAMAMDYLAMGMSELANISERRIEKMMNPTFSELPAFLTKNSGLNSGYMIAHVSAAALVSESKTLCFPSSVDSIPTSTDKEDHVSMGVSSGKKLLSIIKNTRNVLAIELMCGVQALDFQRPLKTSPSLEGVYQLVRNHVPTLKEDRVLSNDIQSIEKLLLNGELLFVVKKHIGELL